MEEGIVEPPVNPYQRYYKQQRVSPARAALVAMVDAGVSFKRRKRCECGATCQDIGGGRCRYERDLPNQRQK